MSVDGDAMEKTPMPRAKPFMERVSPEPNSGCWLWAGSVDYNGYGQVRHNGKTRYAHRVSYEINVGPIPAGLCVCHRCDVPSCVNPDHLFLGTKLDNTQDMIAKGRHYTGLRPAGEDNGNAKLTSEQVREIRAKRAAGRTGSSLAREYGISFQNVSDIHHGKRWRHVN